MDCLNLKYPMNDANYYNQIMRGEIYFLIDNLMVYPKGFDDDLVKNIIEFFDLFISFTVKFLEAIPLFLKDVYIFFKIILKFLKFYIFSTMKPN